MKKKKKSRIHIGILGRGTMAGLHHEIWNRTRGCHVAGMADLVDIPGKKAVADSKTGFYESVESMLADPKIDAVDICLPTYLHGRFIIKSLAAGKHVICEKPLTRKTAEARKVLKALQNAQGTLFVAHCTRFNPVFAHAAQLARGKKYGRLLALNCTRLSETPLHTFNNWILDPELGGSAGMDFHIHDADWILSVCGTPKAVRSTGMSLFKGGVDHIETQYIYGGNGPCVSATASWLMPPGWGFAAKFTMTFEKAVAIHDSTSSVPYIIRTSGGKTIVPDIGDSLGYEEELSYFASCMLRGREPEKVTAASSALSVKVVEAELASVRSGRKVNIRTISV